MFSYQQTHPSRLESRLLLQWCRNRSFIPPPSTLEREAKNDTHYSRKVSSALQQTGQVEMKTNGDGQETTSPVSVTIFFFTENGSGSGSGKGGSENGYGIYGYTKMNKYERIFNKNGR
jgi:hypothetical protein